MKGESITVGVNCVLQVSDSTAEAAPKLVEVYLNAHQGLEIVWGKSRDGSASYRFKEKGESA